MGDISTTTMIIMDAYTSTCSKMVIDMVLDIFRSYWTYVVELGYLINNPRMPHFTLLSIDMTVSMNTTLALASPLMNDPTHELSFCPNSTDALVTEKINIDEIG